MIYTLSTINYIALLILLFNVILVSIVLIKKYIIFKKSENKIKKLINILHEF